MSTTTTFSESAVLSQPDLFTSRAYENPGTWSFTLIWFFTVAIYARPEDIIPSLGQLHLTFVFGTCAGLACFLALASGSLRLLWTSELGIVAMLTVWYVAGVPFAIWRGGSLETLVHVWLKTVFIFFLMTQTLLTLSRIHKVLWAIILSELVVTSLSIARPSSAVWVGDRLLGVNQGILGWNFLGVAAAVTIPYIAALFLIRRNFVLRALLAAAFASMTWMLMLTASRGGILSVGFSVLLTSLLVLRSSFQGKIVGLAIIVGLAVAVMLAPTVFWQRFATVWGDQQVSANQDAASAEESKEDHLFALTQSIEYTLDHPLFGVGLGNFDVASGLELGRWMGPHNTFTQVSSEAGIPALLLFISLPLIALRRLNQIRRRLLGDRDNMEVTLLTGATIASLIAFAFAGFFAHLAYEYYFFYPLAIAVGLQHIAVKQSAYSAQTTA